MVMKLHASLHMSEGMFSLIGDKQKNMFANWISFLGLKKFMELILLQAI